VANEANRSGSINPGKLFAAQSAACARFGDDNSRSLPSVIGIRNVPSQQQLFLWVRAKNRAVCVDLDVSRRMGHTNKRITLFSLNGLGLDVPILATCLFNKLYSGS